MTTMTTRSAGQTGTRWRLINALWSAGTGIRAQTLLDEQDGTTDDLRWMAEAQLLQVTLFGTTTHLDLIEHLNHHGSTMVLGLRLNARGRKVADAPQNRILWALFAASGHKLPLSKVLSDASVDCSQVQNLCRRRLVSAAVRRTGERLTADEVALLPPATLIARLTDKGRTYLPLGS